MFLDQKNLPLEFYHPKYPLKVLQFPFFLQSRYMYWSCSFSVMVIPWNLKLPPQCLWCRRLCVLASFFSWSQHSAPWFCWYRLLSLDVLLIWTLSVVCSLAEECSVVSLLYNGVLPCPGLQSWVAMWTKSITSILMEASLFSRCAESNWPWRRHPLWLWWL